MFYGTSQVTIVVKNPPANSGEIRDVGSILGLGRSPWRRKCQPTTVFLSGESHGQRSLAGSSEKSMGSQRVRHDWSDLAHSVLWTRQAVFLFSFTLFIHTAHHAKVLPILCLFACPSLFQKVSTRAQRSCLLISVDSDLAVSDTTAAPTITWQMSEWADVSLSKRDRPLMQRKPPEQLEGCREYRAPSGSSLSQTSVHNGWRKRAVRRKDDFAKTVSSGSPLLTAHRSWSKPFFQVPTTLCNHTLE